MLLLLFPCKSCYYAQIIFHSWENSLNLKRDKHPSHWCLSLPILHPHCCHQWSECRCPHAGSSLTRFSGLSQLTLPNLFAATWRYVHATCYYSWNAFGLQLFPYYGQYNRLKPSCNCVKYGGLITGNMCIHKLKVTSRHNILSVNELLHFHFILIPGNSSSGNCYSCYCFICH